MASLISFNGGGGGGGSDAARFTRSAHFCTSPVSCLSAGLGLDSNVVIGTGPMNRAMAARRSGGGAETVLLSHEHRYAAPASGGGGSRALVARAIALGQVKVPAAAARQSRSYSVTPVDEFVELACAAALSSHWLHAHELVYGACKLYVDLEFSVVDNPEVDGEQLVQRLLAALAQLTGAQLEWVHEDASDAVKFSRHLVAANTRADSPAVWGALLAEAVELTAADAVWIKPALSARRRWISPCTAAPATRCARCAPPGCAIRTGRCCPWRACAGWT